MIPPPAGWPKAVPPSAGRFAYERHLRLNGETQQVVG